MHLELFGKSSYPLDVLYLKINLSWNAKVFGRVELHFLHIQDIHTYIKLTRKQFAEKMSTHNQTDRNKK